MGEGSRGGGDSSASLANAAAMKAWTVLGSIGAPGGVGAERANSDGRVVLPAPTAQAARGVEERTRAREERHAEGRARILRAMMGGASNLSRAVGLGPWVCPRMRAVVVREAEHGGGDHGGDGIG